MNLCPLVVKRVQRELCTLLKEEIGGISVKPNEEMSTVEAEISGPENTPFEGGVFRVRLVLDAEYPETPPKGTFNSLRAVLWTLSKCFPCGFAQLAPLTEATARLTEQRWWSEASHIIPRERSRRME